MVSALLTGLTINEKIRRSQGDMLGGEPCTKQSPKISPVPAGPVAENNPPSATNPATMSLSTVHKG